MVWQTYGEVFYEYKSMPQVWHTDMQWSKRPTHKVSHWVKWGSLYTYGNVNIYLWYFRAPTYWTWVSWIPMYLTFGLIWIGSIKKTVWYFFTGGVVQANFKFTLIHWPCWKQQYVCTPNHSVQIWIINSCNLQGNVKRLHFPITVYNGLSTNQ